MNVRWVRWGAALFFLLFVLAVTWPGMLPFNRIYPQILGLPFSMVWIALWVLGSFLVLLLVDRVEGRARKAGREGGRGREGRKRESEAAGRDREPEAAGGNWEPGRGRS